MILTHVHAPSTLTAYFSRIQFIIILSLLALSSKRQISRHTPNKFLWICMLCVSHPSSCKHGNKQYIHPPTRALNKTQFIISIKLATCFGTWVPSAQNVNSYALILGTSHYYINLISQYCSFYTSQFFIYFRILIFKTFQ